MSQESLVLAANHVSPLVAAAFVAAAILLIWLLSRGAGWVVRDVFWLRFGFPAQHPPDPGLDRRHCMWTSLLTSRVGSLVTNNVYGATIDEGWRLRSAFTECRSCTRS